MDSSTPSILMPRVRVPNLPSTILWIYIWFVSCRKDENNQKEAGIGPFKKQTIIQTYTFKIGEILIY